MADCLFCQYRTCPVFLLSGTPAPDKNITTDYQFNAGTALLSATSVTTENGQGTGTQTQVTAYFYGRCGVRPELSTMAAEARRL